MDLSVDDVGDWLKSLGLEQYTDSFFVEGVDGERLLELSEESATALGVKKLHRKKLLRGVETLRCPEGHTPNSGDEGAGEVIETPQAEEAHSTRTPDDGAHSTTSTRRASVSSSHQLEGSTSTTTPYVEEPSKHRSHHRHRRQDSTASHKSSRRRRHSRSRRHKSKASSSHHRTESLSSTGATNGTSDRRKSRRPSVSVSRRSHHRHRSRSRSRRHTRTHSRQAGEGGVNVTTKKRDVAVELEEFEAGDELLFGPRLLKPPRHKIAFHGEFVPFQQPDWRGLELRLTDYFAFLNKHKPLPVDPVGWVNKHCVVLDYVKNDDYTEGLPQEWPEWWWTTSGSENSEEEEEEEKPRTIHELRQKKRRERAKLKQKAVARRQRRAVKRERIKQQMLESMQRNKKYADAKMTDFAVPSLRYDTSSSEDGSSSEEVAEDVEARDTDEEKEEVVAVDMPAVEQDDNADKNAEEKDVEDMVRKARERLETQPDEPVFRAIAMAPEEELLLQEIPEEDEDDVKAEEADGNESDDSALGSSEDEEQEQEQAHVSDGYASDDTESIGSDVEAELAAARAALVEMHQAQEEHGFEGTAEVDLDGYASADTESMCSEDERELQAARAQLDLDQMEDDALVSGAAVQLYDDEEYGNEDAPMVVDLGYNDAGVQNDQTFGNAGAASNEPVAVDVDVEAPSGVKEESVSAEEHTTPLHPEASQEPEPEPEAHLREQPSGDAHDWSVEQVQDWLVSLRLPQYTDAFREAEIDGLSLLLLKEEQALGLGVKKLHLKKIMRAVALLSEWRVEGEVSMATI